MSRDWFGTDGVRGIANEKLTPELALKIGSAISQVCTNRGFTKRVAIVRDTRDSGPMLTAALSAGFLAAGWEVADLGILPTPAASYMTRHRGFGMGAVVSASHNPAQYNGIKFFGPDGKKIPDQLEEEAESLFAGPFTLRPTGSGLGSEIHDPELRDAYLASLKAIVPGGLSGMNLAIDCAHGAASYAAQEVFEALGAELRITGAEPDGKNINALGGATKPHVIQEFTVAQKCRLGIAFDGDADRAVFSDEKGRLVNGDRFLAAYVWDLIQSGHKPATVVGTVMSNGGLRKWLKEQGVELVLAPVGDKYVQADIERVSAPVGGEQSGHIIVPALGPTGDGIATGLVYAGIMQRHDVTASFLHDLYESWPQLLFNLDIEDPKNWKRSEAAEKAVAYAETKLGTEGRLNIRPSGTQPILRLMIEADSQRLRDEVADSLIDVFQAELKAKVEGKVDLTHALGD